MEKSFKSSRISFTKHSYVNKISRLDDWCLQEIYTYNSLGGIFKSTVVGGVITFPLFYGGQREVGAIVDFVTESFQRRGDIGNTKGTSQ